MDEEIRDDDDLKGKFDELKAQGKLSACPNLQHLPDVEKDAIIKKVSHHCAELMMRTFISLGVAGECNLVLEDGFTKAQYAMTFKVRKPNETGNG